MERKATDILLDLENKIEKLLLHVANMDNNYKIIISRLDYLKNAGSASVASSNSAPALVLKDSVIQPEHQIISQQTSIKEKSNQESIDFPEYISPTKHNKVRVSQVVKYPKSKTAKQNNVVLASVKIYDSKGVEGGAVVGENRTDQNGRWKIDLSPGNYFVHIVKPASTQKPQIDHYFAINIDDQKASIELDPIG